MPRCNPLGGLTRRCSGLLARHSGGNSSSLAWPKAAELGVVRPVRQHGSESSRGLDSDYKAKTVSRTFKQDRSGSTHIGSLSNRFKPRWWKNTFQHGPGAIGETTRAAMTTVERGRPAFEPAGTALNEKLRV